MKKLILLLLVAVIFTGCAILFANEYEFYNDSSYDIWVKPDGQTSWETIYVTTWSTRPKIVTIPESTISFHYSDRLVSSDAEQREFEDNVVEYDIVNGTPPLIPFGGTPTTITFDDRSPWAIDLVDE